MGRIEDKKEEILNFLDELEEVTPLNFEEYENNITKRLASERVFEKIIEAVNDLAILIIKEERLQLPSEDIKAFDILSDNKIISEELSDKLKQAKGMRNLLAHQYGKVDDEIIFEAIKNEIKNDVEKFLGR
jgi:uncharacterized protein YutE (UPF0331/DUF86 family)